jgi:hypothetical protein
VIQPKSKEQKNQKPAAKPALPLQSTPGIHPLGGSDAGTGR